jgi:hypothetical protein
MSYVYNKDMTKVLYVQDDSTSLCNLLAYIQCITLSANAFSDSGYTGHAEQQDS